MATTPVYRFRLAPDGLMTERQLRAAGLSTAGLEIVGEIRWRRNQKKAYLYDPAGARPIWPMTPGRWRSHEAMMRARRTCPECGTVRDYVISTKYRACADCIPAEVSYAA